MEQLSEQPCFAGLLASAFGLAANVLASIHRTVKRHSQPSEAAGARRRDASTRPSDLTGDASCSGPQFGEGRVSCTLRLRDDVLVFKPWDASLGFEESLELLGADVESTGVVVTLSRNGVLQFSMAFENERVAGLWATKLAVACGSSESISKLFSTQRRRIYALEQRTAEAQMNNEEVERCLNFLSREYVEMRYQVRRQGADPSKEPSLVEGSGCAVGSPPGPLMEADKEEDEPLLIEDVDPPKLPSEPEKEPLNSARTPQPAPQPVQPAASTASLGLQEICEEPRKGPCLLGSSPSHLVKRERREKTSKKDLPLTLKVERGEETPSLPSPRKSVHGRSTRELKKEPLWSPKALSPYGTSLDCPGLDRRGHKLAMTHQRPALGHQRGAKEGPGPSTSRKSGQGVASKTPADKTSVEKRAER